MKRKSNLDRSTNSAKKMRLSRNNHSETHDQNIVEDEINVENKNSNDNNDENINNIFIY